MADQDPDSTPDGVAVVVSGDEKPGARLPDEFLGDHAKDLKEGDDVTLTIKAKVVSTGDGGVDFDFEKVEDCQSEGDGEDTNDDWKDDSSEGDDMDSSFDKYKKDRVSRGKRPEDMD